MNMSRRSVVIVTTVTILGIIAYYPLDPSESVLFPKCPFFWLTGYKCPGCGSQRALHQLLHLHLREAVEYNAFMVFSIPLLLFLTIADINRSKWPRLYLYSRNPVLSWAIFASILLWWIIRNIFSF